MLTQDECYLLQKQTQDWCQRHSPLDIRDESKFAALLEDITMEDDECEIALMAAMYALGPSDAGPPPQQMRDELLELAYCHLSNADKYAQRSVEFAAAYGCGWPGEGVNVPGAWGQPWGLAYQMLMNEVKGWLLSSDEWLRTEVKDYRFREVFREDWFNPFVHHADLLADRFCRGFCNCWQLRDEEGIFDTPIDSNARRKAERCAREHDLLAWNPQKDSLWNFIAQAVKGPKRRGQQTGHLGFASGAFVQGMFYPELYRNDEIDLRFGKVLFKRCHECETEYEGESCTNTDCYMPFDETRTVITDKRRLLVKAPVGCYRPEWWWKCACKNYYKPQNCHPKEDQNGVRHSYCSEIQSQIRSRILERVRREVKPAQAQEEGTVLPANIIYDMVASGFSPEQAVDAILDGMHDRCPLSGCPKGQPRHPQRATGVWVWHPRGRHPRPEERTALEDSERIAEKLYNEWGGVDDDTTEDASA
jgi:hypothetical protein